MSDRGAPAGDHAFPNQAPAFTDTDPASVELTPEEYAELIDPESWADILALYARTMRLAVALVDPQGRLSGTCHNPQPIWSLARAARPEWGTGCLFCMELGEACTAAAEAVRTDSVVVARDRAGFAHIASPLSLGGRHLGMLLAGQVFDRFPEPMPLERLARDLGLSAQQVWHLARQEAPISRNQLTIYGDLLHTLSQAFLRERYSKILERKLAKTNLRFQLLVEGVKEYAIFTVDGSGLVASWNEGAARLLGYAEAEILGRPFSWIFVPEDIENGAPETDLKKAAREGRAVNDRWYVRKDGERLFVSGILTSIGESDIREFGMIMHDITDRLKAEAALLRKQKLESLGVLAGGVAHDFNNLLTVILGNASLLIEGTSESGPQRAGLKTIVSAGEQAATLVRQLLAYAGVARFAVTRFGVSELVSGMRRLIEIAIPPGVRLEVEITSDLPSIKADRSQIRQIVMDLVMNAAEAMGPEGGTVWVSTGLAGTQPEHESDPGRFVYIEVRDSGCGMDESLQAKIFDPFFTTKFVGRGLGLAAVSGIVRSHRGTMSVVSAPGMGSTFRVLLPALS